MDALGLIETTNLAGAMEASTAASQAATASVSSVTLIDASFVVVKIEGDMPAVRAAIEAGAHAAQQSGSLICARIIPHREGKLASVVTPKRSRPVVASAPVTKKATGATRGRKPKVVVAAPVRQTVTPQAAPAVSSPKSLSGSMSMEQLEALPVSKLRQYARGLAGLPIQGRQISMANKQQLLEAIKQIG
ncbi:MAG: BMC domain-containing protein [bacterium]|nr:BMC domain-containing protein [bacterium]